MKTLVFAALLLATPALASPRHPTPAQWRDMRATEEAYGACHYRTPPDIVKKGCAKLERLRKKMTAQGFCVVGRGEVGRAGGPMKDYPRRNHCYTIHDPSPYR